MAAELRQGWNDARTRFQTVLQSTDDQTAASNLSAPYQQWLAIYIQAITDKNRIEMSQREKWVDPRTVCAVGDTVAFGAGIAGALLSNTEMGQEHDWLKIAAPCFLGVAQVFSKANNVLTYRADQQAAIFEELIQIAGQKALLELAGQLVGSTNMQGRAVVPRDDLSGVQWKAMKGLCLHLFENRDDVVLDMEGGGFSQAVETDHLLPFSRQNSGDAVPWN